MENTEGHFWKLPIRLKTVSAHLCAWPAYGNLLRDPPPWQLLGQSHHLSAPTTGLLSCPRSEPGIRSLVQLQVPSRNIWQTLQMTLWCLPSWDLGLEILPPTSFFPCEEDGWEVTKINTAFPGKSADKTFLPCVLSLYPFISQSKLGCSRVSRIVELLLGPCFCKVCTWQCVSHLFGGLLSIIVASV